MPRGIIRRQSDVQRARGIVVYERTAAVLNRLLSVFADGVHITREYGLSRACGSAVHIDVDLACLLRKDAVLL